jgi:hypothetical protein
VGYRNGDDKKWGRGGSRLQNKVKVARTSEICATLDFGKGSLRSVPVKCWKRLGIMMMMEAVRTSETSVDNHFTRQYIPEDNSEQYDVLDCEWEPNCSWIPARSRTRQMKGVSWTAKRGFKAANENGKKCAFKWTVGNYLIPSFILSFYTFFLDLCLILFHVFIPTFLRSSKSCLCPPRGTI